MQLSLHLLFFPDFGSMTLVVGFEHGILHYIRLLVAGDAWIIYGMDVGRSGMVACLLLLPIVLPMKFDFFKKRVRPKCISKTWRLQRRYGVVSIILEHVLAQARESLKANPAQPTCTNEPR